VNLLLIALTSRSVASSLGGGGLWGSLSYQESGEPIGDRWMDISDPYDGHSAAAHGVVERWEVMPYIKSSVFQRKCQTISGAPRQLVTRTIIPAHQARPIASVNH
jgi:hypothetical protein